MRLHRCVPVFATVATLAGAGTPAYAFERASLGGGENKPAAVVRQHSTSSVDWVIGVGSAGGIIVLGAGAATAHRRVRKTPRATGAVS